uniref:Transforming acidic coiled-coil-containing protein C-terminal domain-containing protein n=1 Tax=Periophthalmus magnuspinnatus TaxID=409849 RepID=A0A3B3ZXF8_9GOBI
MGRDLPTPPGSAPLEIQIEKCYDEKAPPPSVSPQIRVTTSPSPAPEMHQHENKMESQEITSQITDSAPKNTEILPDVKREGKGLVPHFDNEFDKLPLNSETQNNEFCKSQKSKPAPLKMQNPPEEFQQDDAETEIPVPKVSYKFDPENFDESFDPFSSGGSKIPNSPPPCGASNATPELVVKKHDTEESKWTEMDGNLDQKIVAKSPLKKQAAKKTTSKVKKQNLEEKSPTKSLEVVPELSNFDETEIQIPKVSYKFDPENLDESFDPFSSGGSKIPNSPPPSSFTNFEDESLKAKPVVLEFTLDETETVSKPPPKKLGARKTIGKVKNQKSKTGEEKRGMKSDSEPAGPVQETSNPPNSTSPPPPNVDDIPIPKKGTYNFDPENFDDSFNPFKSGGSKIQNSPTSKTFPELDPQEDLKAKSIVLEVGLDDKTVTKPPPKKLGQRKTFNKGKISKPKSAEEDLDVQSEGKVPEIPKENTQKPSSPPPSVTDDVPKSGAYDLDPSRWDDPKFDPFGGGSKLGKPKTSYRGILLLLMLLLLLLLLHTTYPNTVFCSHSSGRRYLSKSIYILVMFVQILTKELEVEEWKRRYEESRAEVLEMRDSQSFCFALCGTEDDRQQKSLSSSASFRQLTLERDQALSDLSSVERSFSELFRRYENMKGVLEGFKKNEEVLKRCAQEYLQRIKQEEQRYQTLKAHAEEKLDKANQEIAQVRSKAASETVALGASLRKEQMKAESLERAVQQKNQEIEELTKICDELISKLGPA